MIPLWIKILYTILAVVVVIFYLYHYGYRNFFWFSDIALIVTVPALWLESPYLSSMMAVGVLLPELAWNVSFFGRLLFGVRTTGMASYMFNSDKPLYLRMLSLFHVVLPVILFLLVAKLGYEPGAWIGQTLLAWIVLPLSYLFTDPQKNVNWVFGLNDEPQNRISPLAYLTALMVAFPLLVYLPTHILLMYLH